MRPVTLLVLVVALILGGAAAFLVRGLLLQRSTAAPAKPASTVVVANQPLAFGTALSAENTTEVAWPTEAAPEGFFRSREELFRDGKRVVLAAMQKNEPVLAAKITGSGQRASLSALIDAGMRAVTIRVDEVRGVAGFVLPGDRIDVVLTRAENNGSYADILLQNVKVLAIDQLASDSQGKPTVARAVTLEVNTTQAQKLVLASGIGNLSLVLRQAGGTDPETTRRVTTADLGGGEYVDKSRQEATERLAAMEQRISELRRAAEGAGSTQLEDALARVRDLEGRMQAEFARLNGKTEIKLPEATPQAPPLLDTTIIRVMRGLKQEEVSVPKDARR